jgi:hypothetical protein
MYGDEQRSRATYARLLMGGLGGKRSDASLCTECKKCVERCPQHIAIPEQLKSVSNDLGGRKTKAILATQKKRNPKNPAKPE